MNDISDFGCSISDFFSELELNELKNFWNFFNPLPCPHGN